MNGHGCGCETTQVIGAGPLGHLFARSSGHGRQGFASLTILVILVSCDAVLSLARHIAVSCMDGLVDEHPSQDLESFQISMHCIFWLLFIANSNFNSRKKVYPNLDSLLGRLIGRRTELEKKLERTRDLPTLSFLAPTCRCATSRQLPLPWVNCVRKHAQLLIHYPCELPGYGRIWPWRNWEIDYSFTFTFTINMHPHHFWQVNPSGKIRGISHRPSLSMQLSLPFVNIYPSQCL